MTIAKKILTSGIVVSLLLAMAVMFAGCGGPETLEEYINSDEEAKSTIDSLSTSGMTVDVTGNTLTYTYTYPQTFDAATVELMKSELGNAMESMDSSFESIGDTLEEGSGIDDITVRVVYEDAAGTELFSEDY